MLPQLPSRCLSSYQSLLESDVIRDPRPTPQSGDPRPIFQLAAGDWVLFAELVQSTLQSGGKEMMWARPLMLVCKQDRYCEATNLKGASDLLWPAAHFTPAYVEEMIPYMAESVTVSSDLAQQQLRKFVQLVWDAYEGCPAAS